MGAAIGRCDRGWVAMVDQIREHLARDERQIASDDEPSRLRMLLQRCRDARDWADARLPIDNLRKGCAGRLIALIRTNRHEGRARRLRDSRSNVHCELRSPVIRKRGLVAAHACAGAAGENETERAGAGMRVSGGVGS